MLKKLLPVFATLYALTLRLKWLGTPLPNKCVVVFWHGQMFGGWYAMRRHTPIALVSKSKDGAYLASVLRRWGYSLSRGSSKKQGMEALQSAMALLNDRERGALVITPDGPRGPRHEFKRGAFIAARDLNVPLIYLEVRYSSAYTFRKSWDNFELPLPFSKIHLTATPLDAQHFPLDIELQHDWLQALERRLGL